MSMSRFEVHETNEGKYLVVDSTNGRTLRYSYELTHSMPGKPPAEWNNYYSARGFAQRMSHYYPERNA